MENPNDERIGHMTMRFLRRKRALDTFRCPVDGTRQPSGFAGKLDRATITDHEVRPPCGHTHRLDLTRGTWAVRTVE